MMEWSALLIRKMSRRWLLATDEQVALGASVSTELRGTEMDSVRVQILPEEVLDRHCHSRAIFLSDKLALSSTNIWLHVFPCWKASLSTLLLGPSVNTTAQFTGWCSSARLSCCWVSQEDSWPGRKPLLLSLSAPFPRPRAVLCNND